MNRTVWLARLLSIGAALETLAGLGLLLDPPGAAAALLGSPLNASGIVFARIAGAGLLGLGIACWGARKAPLTPAGLGTSWGFFAYNVVTCVTMAWAGSALASDGLMAFGASVLHGVLGAALLGPLLGSRQAR